jgi:hypothetical protein
VKLVDSTIDAFASSLQQDGQALVYAQGVWWRRVRPFFYRPMLGFETCPKVIPPPHWQAKLGGFQFPVENPADANSHLGYLVFENLADYTLESLHGSRRWEVRNAAKRFTLRPFASAQEFSQLAHPVYMSFQGRTGYGYRSDRRKASNFLVWSRQLFGTGGANVWGAFDGEQLAAVSIFRIVEGNLVYSTFFAETEGLRNHVAGFLLHRIRESARQHPGLVRMVVGSPKLSHDSRSVDQFYLSRGCEIVWRPARLCLNPLTERVLRGCRPSLLDQLRGAETGTDKF